MGPGLRRALRKTRVTTARRQKGGSQRNFWKKCAGVFRGGSGGDRRESQHLGYQEINSGQESGTAVCPSCFERESGIEASGDRWNGKSLGTLKHSASVPPLPPHSIQSKQRGPATPATEPRLRIVPPTSTHRLTLALELADDRVQVRVLGRDVAPADRHLLAAASPRLPAPLSVLGLSGVRLRVGTSSGEGRGAPCPACPPASMLRFPAPPSQARRGRTSLPLLPPRSCPRRGAERSRARRRGGVRGAGATSPGPNGAGAGPWLLVGGAGQKCRARNGVRAPLRNFFLVLSHWPMASTPLGPSRNTNTEG